MKRFIRKWLDRIAQPYLNEITRINATAPATQIAQKALFQQYQTYAHTGRLPNIRTTGYRVFSQFDEDGIFVYLFALIGFGTCRFVDVGSGDGIMSNCANLAIHFGLRGLFVDGNSEALALGRKFYAAQPNTFLYPPLFVNSFIPERNYANCGRSCWHCCV
ncbi:MAG: hypothetical protein L6Q98_23405 [Anaerolineae bacterium]|nr:hypothetical protein [Anaerolineae bacterium]NUQ06282.1 hypothetical protein [Anaerolineae bacterium]